MSRMIHFTAAAATTAALLAPALALTASPASAAATVSVSNGDGAATAATDGPTTLSVTGRGFQAIQGGAGGIYVAFGWVSDPQGGAWKPSQGGATGDDYRYVPDAESSDNEGHQRFIAFPGADTADSASGTMTGSGGWSTTVSVPGATFSAVDRSGKSVAVDCTQVTCGVITIGAHGIKNPKNETFTPVRFVAGAGSSQQQTQTQPEPEQGAVATPPAPQATQAPGAGATQAPVAPGNATVDVDRATAVVGRVLTFSGKGFQPGEQVVATLDDGVAAVGPLSAGQSGEVAGVLQLPASIEAGTHVLRLSGAASGAAPEVAFPIAPAAAVVDAGAEEDEGPTVAAWVFLAAAGVLLLLALLLAVLRVRRARRAKKSADTAPAAGPAGAGAGTAGPSTATPPDASPQTAESLSSFDRAETVEQPRTSYQSPFDADRTVNR